MRRRRDGLASQVPGRYGAAATLGFGGRDQRMPLFRLLVILGLLALGCAGCGRRGPLESPVAAASPAPPRTAPPAAANPVSGPAALPDTIGLDDGGTQAVDPTLHQVPDVTGIAQAPTQSSRSRRRNYVIPREPFPLDPLL